MTSRVGVVVMAYGTPRDRDDIARYYTDIRRGRPPDPAALAELTARYDAIGGTFPLRAITQAQCTVLQQALDELEPERYVVRLGQKHSPPTIEDAVADLADADVATVVGLVLAPHYSAYSVGEYAARVHAAATAHNLPDTTIESWHLLPEYVEFLARAVREARAGLAEPAEVVFTAHSLPARIRDVGDPYPDGLHETAHAVADAAGLTRWSVAWQSAGRTAEEWLGPDVTDAIRGCAANGAAAVVVCPCGFTADHLEVRYDLDIEAAHVAAEAGVAFRRTRSLNDEPSVLRALAQLVAQVAASSA